MRMHQSMWIQAPFCASCVLSLVGCLAYGPPSVPPSASLPLGFAYVNADGTVDESKSMNVTSANVQKHSSHLGMYGFRNLSFEPRNVQVTLAFDTHAITGDNRTGSRAFVGDCSFFQGEDQACVIVNSDPDWPGGSNGEAFFVLFF